VDDTLHNSDDLIAELDRMAIRTSQGSFLKKEDVVELIEKRKKANAVEQATAPKPKNLDEARSQATKFLKEQNGIQPPREPGRSISAQPSSRT